MPLYVVGFRTTDGFHGSVDAEEFPDLEAVRRDCIISAKQVVAEALRYGSPLQEAADCYFEVTDEDGNNLLSMPFEEALSIDARGYSASLSDSELGISSHQHKSSGPSTHIGERP